jgi:hypothetical protein
MAQITLWLKTETRSYVQTALVQACKSDGGFLTVHDVLLDLPVSAFRSDVTFNEGHKICPPVKK